MFRNWKAICAETDQGLRFLAATATDERVLDGLEAGFPEFFTSEEQKPCIPLSVFRAWRPGFTDDWMADNALDHFGIPHFDFGEMVDVAIPKEWERLLGKRDICLLEDDLSNADFVYVVWQGKKCLVAERTTSDLLIVVPEGFLDLRS